MEHSEQKKACWACRSSKIRCNRNTPTCLQCLRTGKGCQYGLRLSWPRESDARRSIVCRARPNTRASNCETHFVNTRFADVELHYALYHSQLYHWGNRTTALECLSHQYKTSVSHGIPRPLPWIASGNSQNESHLLSYYDEVLSVMLTSIDDPKFRSLLISMSFIDSAPSSIAVQQALYALIAIHIYGPTEAKRYKLRAITALSQSFNNPLSTKEGLQQIAARLLLSICEMLDSSESPQLWKFHAGMAKQIGIKICSSNQSYGGDVSVVLNWLFYHEALARFSGRHWNSIGFFSVEAHCMRDSLITRAVLLSSDASKIINMAGCSAEVLSIIPRISDNVRSRADTNHSQIETVEALNMLERRLTHLKQYVDQDDGSDRSSQHRHALNIAELYRLASLVYLQRAGKGYPTNKPGVLSLVNAGFEIIATLQTCPRVFPLIILGCEARSDEDRMIILELLRKTENSRRIGNFSRARRFIEASWAQDDLHTGELDYVQKFDTIMSRSEDMPSFS
ncbi:hypothetical protein EJ08DRAFT_239139 [Tothia fuscella]|uniref:Zn(2)-C6 fungal-type domain-containing protein n=1 Tax=Tothia fuscella TaxID=1048955 RepID=A0A9P4TZ69_9PEZI|nr:hypothetical protein EJ08DRAFT_239139 [Tothia fuscella]